MKPDSKHTSVTGLSPSASSSQDLLMRRRLTNSMKQRPVACLNTAAEVGRLHAQMFGDFLQRQLAGVVGEDVIHRAVGAIDVVSRRPVAASLRPTATENRRWRRAIPAESKSARAGSRPGCRRCVASAVMAWRMVCLQRNSMPYCARSSRGARVFELGEHLMAAFEQLVGEVDQHVALGHHFVFGHLADPVVRQVGAGEEQCFADRSCRCSRR